MTSASTPAAQLRTDTYAYGTPGPSSVLTVYTLQQGETLAQVAAKFGISPQALLNANPQLIQQITTTGLYAGTQLNIPAAVPLAPQPSAVYPLPNYSQPNYTPPVGLAPPTGGVSTQAPYAPPVSRSFFSDPSSAAPAPVPISWPKSPRTLQYGATVPDVETLQRALSRIGYALKIDGNFGGGTDAVIRNFQSLVGLTPNGVVDKQTWEQLIRAADAVRSPSQVVVTARRDQFQSEDERNAYDILTTLAYDYAGQAATSTSDGYGLRELLRLCGQPLTTPTTITPEAVTAFAYKALEAGMPLNEQSLKPLRVLQVIGYNRPTYHESKALGDFFVRVLPGRSSVNHQGYDALIVATARQYGVPPELVKAVMSAESSFRPGEVSSANAQGLMQVMPDTAAFVGVPDTSTPENNVKAGVIYLAYLLRRFNGDLVNSIAGYNAGPNRVDNNGGVPPIQETMDYVRKVLVNYAYYLQHPPQGA